MLIFPAILDGVRTLKDRSLNVTLQTQELNSKEMADLFDLSNKLVYVGINHDKNLNPDRLDINEMPKEFEGQKSQSKRLHDVLYVYWNKHKPTKDFETFYKRKTEEFINLVKENIN